MTHPDGRRPLSVNQGPTNGTHYPFVCPSDDVSLLLADAYLSYEDGECRFKRPFRIAWLYGFGSDAAATPPFAPTPVNAQEILIFDAEDRVVFDSTNAIDFASVDWPITTPRAKVLEWKTAVAVARVTWHTEFSPNQDVKTYSVSFEPDNGQLDARVANRRSPRVTSLRVGVTTFGPDEIVEFVSGFNVNQTVSTFATDGGRKGVNILFDAAPGSGPKGRFPGCEDPDIVIRRINGQSPLSNGNFILDATGCYAIRQPTTLVANPSALPGAPPFAAVPAEATLQAFNDCEPCCDCPDYIRTYEGLRALAEKYEALGAQAEAIRDQHKENSERWAEDVACRAEEACRTSLFNLPEMAATLAGSYCEFGDECVEGTVELRFKVTGPTFSYREGTGFRTGKNGFESYVPTVVGDTVSFFFENAEPFQSNAGQAILDFDDTGTVTILLTSLVNGEEICTSESATNLLP